MYNQVDDDAKTDEMHFSIHIHIHIHIEMWYWIEIEKRVVKIRSDVLAEHNKIDKNLWEENLIQM